MLRVCRAKVDFLSGKPRRRSRDVIVMASQPQTESALRDRARDEECCARGKSANQHRLKAAAK